MLRSISSRDRSSLCSSEVEIVLSPRIARSLFAPAFHLQFYRSRVDGELDLFDQTAEKVCRTFDASSPGAPVLLGIKLRLSQTFDQQLIGQFVQQISDIGRRQFVEFDQDIGSEIWLIEVRVDSGNHDVRTFAWKKSQLFAERSVSINIDIFRPDISNSGLPLPKPKREMLRADRLTKRSEALVQSRKLRLIFDH